MPPSTRLWPTLKQVLRRQELMDRMMQTSGVDVLTAVRVDGGLALIEARAKCRFCLHEGACRDWLEFILRGCKCLRVSAPMRASYARAGAKTAEPVA